MGRGGGVMRIIGVVGVALALAVVIAYAVVWWPAVAVPVVLVAGLIGWWRFYHSLMRRAEAAERERRRGAGRE